MTVYVDDMFREATVPNGARSVTSAWCHMQADTREDRPEMAEADPETLRVMDEMRYIIPPDGPLGEKKGIWYTQGDCWALALAIHRMTGWPLTALGYADEDATPYTERGWVHIVVRVPDGRLLDVRGLREEDECAREFLWSNYSFYEVTPRELLIDFEKTGVRDPSPSSLSFASDYSMVVEDAERLLSACMIR